MKHPDFDKYENQQILAKLLALSISINLTQINQGRMEHYLCYHYSHVIESAFLIMHFLLDRHDTSGN
jgi:hypothetical protein